ncbi:MAG: DUF3329 domain-containing protein [Geminicoccaceae bacterium]|jgi:hypothetical protein
MAEPHPWLMPLPRRVAVLGLAVAWCAFEGWYEPGGLWFWLAAGIVAYGVWDFFLSGAYPARGGAP